MSRQTRDGAVGPSGVRVAALLSALAAGASAFAACTTFDGLTAASPEPADSSPPPDAMVDDDAPAQDAPVNKLPSYLPIESAVKVCSMAVSCPQLAKSVQASLSIPLDTLNFSTCVDWLAGPLPPDRIGISVQGTELACVAAARTCPEAKTCLSQEFLDPTDSRCAKIPLDAGRDAGTGAYEYCDDAGAVVRCSPQYIHDVLHCTSGRYAPSSRCMAGTDGTHWCARGSGCPQTTCSSNLIEFCGGIGLNQGQNCAIEGQTCGEDVTNDSGVPACITGDRVKTCSAMGTECVGSAVSVCDGFTRTEYNCAALNGSCTKASGTARCKRNNDVCAPEDPAVNHCSGTQISLCIGGQPTTFDCASVGLRCVPGGTSTSGLCQ
jgi:hypothetical protein